MQIKKLVEKLEVTDITCDICNNSCFNEHGSCECVTIYHSWGYYSKKDGTIIECDICESCFEKVQDFIVNTLKGKVREDVYM